MLVTFHLLLFARIFFRAGSLHDALFIVKRICTDLSSPIYLGFSSVGTMLGLALVVMLLVVQCLQYKNRLPLNLSPVRVPVLLRWSGYLAMLLAIAMLGKSGNDFIYFQF